MNELYWLTTLGKINTFLWIGLGISILTSLFFLAEFRESSYGDEEYIESKKMLKLSALVMLILSCGCTLTPSKKDLYLIYGAGTIVDYCKDNQKVKEIPDKAIEALNRYLDSIRG